MAQLSKNNDFLLRVLKSEERLLWYIYIGDTLEGWSPVNWNFTPAFPIIMDANGINKFSNEIKRVIKEKPRNEEELNLTFVENKPQFKVKVKFEEDRAKISTKRFQDSFFEISVGFNLFFATVRDDREENSYLYENGGGHRYLGNYFYEDELAQFIVELENEITMLAS